MGFIDFSTGDVLTANQMDTVLRQSVMRFADAAERDTAIGTAIAEGMMAYLDDTNEVLKYDGSQWIDISGDITGVTAGTALTGGGTSGNVTLDVDLSAISIPTSQITDITASATELNFVDGVTSGIQSQIDSKQEDVITTQGDLVIGDASGSPVRLPVGSADQVLTSDGTTVNFQDPAPSGIQETIFDAAGDIIYATGADTAARLPRGTEGQVLTATGSSINWETASAPPTEFVELFNGSIPTGAASSSINFGTTAYQKYTIYLNGLSSNVAAFFKYQLKDDAGTALTAPIQIQEEYTETITKKIDFDPLTNETDFNMASRGSFEGIEMALTIDGARGNSLSVFSYAGGSDATDGRNYKLSGQVTVPSGQYLRTITLTVSDGTIPGGTIRIYGA